MAERVRAVRAKTRTRRARLTALLVAMAIVAGFSVFLASPGTAGHGDGTPEVTPTRINGNPNCSRFGGTVEVKIEPVADGTFGPFATSFGNVFVTLVVDETAKSFEFDLSDNVLAQHVLVKGGPAANDYNYSLQPGGGINHDDGLVAPNNQGLSHISFCLIEAPKFGAIEITKTVKNPADGTLPLAGAVFSISPGTATDTTDANGIACFENLAFGDYTITEDSAPAGYAKADPQDVTVDQEGTCSDGNAETVSFEDAPLTDLSIDVTAQVPDASLSTINCDDGSSSGAADDPASLDVTDLEPGTIVCTIVIDP
jgi:hypothetical protein